MRTPFTGHPSEGGIFMKYSYEYKRQCVTLYRQGSWPLTPKGVHPKRFRNMIPSGAVWSSQDIPYPPFSQLYHQPQTSTTLDASDGTRGKTAKS